MDSFELSTDSYNPGSLRNRPRRKPVQPDDSEPPELEEIESPRTPVTPDDDFMPEPAPRPERRAARRPAAPRIKPRPERQSEPDISPKAAEATVAADHKTSAADAIRDISIDFSSFKKFFADGRLAIFAGVVLILFAAYMLVASISYIANASADQSVLVNSSAELLKQRSASVENTTGWVGAFLSHFLIYRWLGLGGFIIIFYIGALGLTLVKLCNFRFWPLTFKSLVSAVAVSLIAGLVTFRSESPEFWGGEHGYYINALLIDNASLWSAVAVGIAMMTALILIFIKPLAYIFSMIGRHLSTIRERMARRHDEAIAAAHRAEVRQQAEMEAERARVKAEKEEQQRREAEAAFDKPAPADEIYSPLNAPKTEQEQPKSAEINVAPNYRITTVPTENTLSETPLVTREAESPADPLPSEEAERDIELPFVEIGDISLPKAEEKEAVSPENDEAEESAHSLAYDSQPELTLDAESPATVSLSLDTAETGVTALTDISAPAENDFSDMPDIVITQENDNIEDRDLPAIDIPMTVETTQLPPVSEADIPVLQPSSETSSLNDSANYDPRADLSHYRFPGLELLNDIQETEIPVDEEEQEANKERITNILRSYGVEIASIRATIGPTITLYEIVPAPGVRIAKIKRLGDDVALNLAAMGIRIIAPIPGKGTIGMEVPNKNPRVVSIRSILSSAAYRNSKAQLPMALGTTISNEVYVADLAKMPHLLVAGATGMGKSVGLNTIIASLLYRKHPAELKFVLVDPKMVEFSLYKCIERHFLAKLPEEESAIITQPENVVATLNSLCKEMDDRYLLLSEAGMRGIKEYNEKFVARKLNPEKGHRFLPYIVVIIDEFADLILTVGKEVETPISRIAAKARAVGIHMILATQRPSVNVITGVIKANFPGRIAFRVTQRNDSQTILDRPGAEQLIGRGDMLISRDGIIDRVQCAFIDTPEVEDICRFISDQQAYPMAYELPELTTASDGSAAGNAVADRDSMFADAGREVISSGVASASSLQRKFNIGYPRAGKIIDQLEAAGVIGPAQGAKPRAVLMDMYSFERYLES